MPLFDDTELEFEILEEAGEFELNEDAAVDVPATTEGDLLINESIEKLGLLSEYDTSHIMVGRKEKVRRVEAQAAFVIAREADDPLFRKLEALNKKRNELKRKIEQKYGSKGKMRAREIMSGRGIETGKDMPKASNEK